ncbi:DUF1839 family protein [Exilibacterium tricleocarpae]|uniref:DUF1839 family protein n=1 Tax=Exilibacterium tricleocarpae TaxID=2591008 RepID=A0A545T3G9_9GAMM|nr:DUF1839 family protein [Exilibacterium tricleocarpae]TQV71764.1 DUF1839 family protein [Exilibacterium tricleocarpae]
MLKQILPIDASRYQNHAIHGADRCWAETNCYVDVMVELLHGLELEPIAALPFTLCIDFEGDQWTFFKFPHQDLFTLFGIEIQELNPWLSFATHVEEQVSLGRPVLVEVDSYFLPDTAGTAYQTEHVKTTIAVNAVDIENARLGYFHGQGYYELDGENCRELLQLDGIPNPRVLPPYIEYLKLRPQLIETDRRPLPQKSVEVLRRNLALTPSDNPFTRFKERFEADLDWLMAESIETFHKYSFATLRQYGACFELVETYLRWLERHGETGLNGAVEAFGSLSTTAKAFQFQLARAMARKRALDTSTINTMGEHWEQGMQTLRQKYA